MNPIRWNITRLRYFLHGQWLHGRPGDKVWYFAFGANMHDSVFLGRRGMMPLAWRVGRVAGYRLRFNLEGRPRGKAAPANISADPNGELWGVLYQITRAGLVHLNSTEGVPGRRYRPLLVQAETPGAGSVTAITYIAKGRETDGRPSLRYITLLREGARAHGLPEPYVKFLDDVRPAE